uniref:Uncharacterized protein n=1 Tax=Sipha flava TaxID=143950 RepID=A0A2S2Q605_9HEMI
MCTINDLYLYNALFSKSPARFIPFSNINTLTRVESFSILVIRYVRNNTKTRTLITVCVRNIIKRVFINITINRQSRWFYGLRLCSLKNTTHYNRERSRYLLLSTTNTFADPI